MPDIDLLGAVYPDVPAVDLPSGGGTARFYYPSEIKYAASETSGGPATRTNGLPYGVVDGTSTATAFTVTISGITTLYDGLCILVKNNVIASKADCTLNVNGLGAKRIHYNTAANSQITTQWSATMTAMFYYDSTRNSSAGAWVMFYGYDSNTNTIGYQVRTNSMSLPMKSIVYRYRLLFTSADGKGFVPANNSTSTNATTARTVCQDKIDPFGRIVYYGTTASVAAGSRPSASYLWQQYTFTIGYSFVVTLTEWKPVYLKCAPQTDGSAIIDSTTPFVQDLPSTEDGKIYIFLGVAYSSTAMEMTLEHPVYWYKDGMIRPYTNAPAGGAVASVNGQTGAVVLDADDVGALPDSTTYVSSFNGSTGAVTYTAPVTSVNTKTGAVSLSASDVGALPDSTTYVSSFNGSTGAVTYTAPVTSVNGNTGAVTVTVPSASSVTPQALGTAAAGSSTDYSRADHVHAKPTYSKSDVGLGNVDNVQQYSASNPPPYPVTSVNGSTGAVTVSVPTKTSDLNNDSGYITGMYIASYGVSTYADILAAFEANKVVYCKASSNANPATGTQGRLAFLAFVDYQSSTIAGFEFQYYRSISSHSASQQGDQVFVYKITSDGTWTVTTREAATKIAAGTGLGSSYANGTLTITNSRTGLPSVSASDNGKVLTVVNGAWAAASLPIYNGGVS